ncbi:MAG: oligogalacturonide lyase [Bryobacterales bacterium]|nr:oligogalacturonide lyase [Bryobacterales bacterium]
MTAPHLRQFGRRSDTLLYWSERFGARQAFQLDLKSGDSHQVTEAAALDPLSIALSADERSVYYFDRASLFESSLGSLRKRELHTVAAGVIRTGLALTTDGSAVFAERQGGASRIVRILRTGPKTVLEIDGSIDFVMARPRHPQLLYQAGGALWLVNPDGSGKTRLKLEPGQTGEVLWTQTGRTLLYLHIPDDPKQLITLRENDPGEKTDKQIARTSQFESVAPNGDGSVFVGASRSRASAYVLLLLRVTRRELTLCEHRASDPGMVLPIFSPDSQSVFFASDRHGKQALYRVRIEKFVEETSADSGPQ